MDPRGYSRARVGKDYDGGRQQRSARHDHASQRYERGRHDYRDAAGDDGRARRRSTSRGSRSYPARRDHSAGMYDDAPTEGARSRRDRHDDDWSGGDYQQHHHRDERRSRSRSRDAGRPTDTVILEGLPHSISTSQLRESLLRCSILSELPTSEIRIPSSRGNRRAFVQFDQVDDAITFMKEHFPTLLVRLEHSTDDVPDGTFATQVHYARSRDNDGNGSSQTNSGNWSCPSCDFSNYATRNVCRKCGAAPSASDSREGLTGAADCGNDPSQILVVYPLPYFVDEQMFARDVMQLEIQKAEPSKDQAAGTATGPPQLKSTAPQFKAASNGARPGSLHRVFLMRDVSTGQSSKFGFVEFWTLEDAIAAMAKVRMLPSLNVAGTDVKVSNIHMGVFLPETRTRSPETDHLSFFPLFNPELRVRHRDLRVYPSRLDVNATPPVVENASKPADDSGNDKKKAKKRKADANLVAASAKKPAPMAGQMAMWQKKHVELHDGGDTPAPNQGSQPSRSDLNNPNKMALSQSRAPIKISISGSKTLAAITSPPGSTDGANAGTQAESNDGNASEPGGKTASEESGKEETYTEPGRMMCFLCMLKFKTQEELSKHVQGPGHRAALQNEDLIKAALPRLVKRDKRLQQQRAAEEKSAQDAQYRDRAKERREAYSQPKMPTAQSSKPKSERKPAKREDDPASAPKPAPSKGAGILAKMGWTAGSGLGANADGRTDVVASHAYQEGVGLGAEGGNLGDAARLAEQKTKNSYAQYLNTVQDKARERFNKLA
ncbi:hypothetical protein S7711_05553 [Stachybotrys chartarum IBT 7711]|uniref:G-patch domain-containing protein n=1 Tax=Stachybotrys chartarum (strain CBS 109288 / IBT 7711) TaxID=1280523 RepID=A0A084AK94_STACB|nr:hypothetical protein S7711_05553 [Stachybotrys chartarum IBT 7711]KFA54013.1 hypothetical protein S40293_01819 [Stachybotrys chartarum IBT 40293]